MKINKKTKARWSASDTARGIKVRLMANQEKHDLGRELFFDSMAEVKQYCKGEIVVTTRKVVTSKKTVISE